MKRNFLLYLTVGIIGLTVAASNSHAQPALPPINGYINFGGIAKANGPLISATAFTNFNSYVGLNESGAYTNVPAYTPVNWNPFIFNPPATSVVPLWTVTTNGVTYSFDATSLTVAYQTTNIVNIQGTGIAHITGFADTPGTWAINGSSLTFSAYADVSAANIPLLKIVSQTSSTIAFTWNALPGQSYQLQYRTNLAQPGWINLGSSVVATNPIVSASDAIGPDDTRFFRVILAP